MRILRLSQHEQKSYRLQQYAELAVVFIPALICLNRKGIEERVLQLNGVAISDYDGMIRLGEASRRGTLGH